ncbi:MAG TPA: L,D-transpeptidase family protein [Chloroflexota bacterium]
MPKIRVSLFVALLAGLGGLLMPASDGRTALQDATALAAPASQPPARDRQAIELPGRVIEAVHLRTEPRVDADTLLRTLQPNEPVSVYEAVTAADGDTWYRVGDSEYTHAAEVRLPRPPPRSYPGRWIDADLQEPALLTAYEDNRAVYSTLTLFGQTATETAQGEHRIGRRVANETMDSATLGIPRGSPQGYYLKDVLYTQYFTDDGAAIHYNYWSSNFGHPGSHGCLGVSLDDAKWFWDWADHGTVLNVHA